MIVVGGTLKSANGLAWVNLSKVFGRACLLDFSFLPSPVLSPSLIQFPLPFPAPKERILRLGLAYVNRTQPRIKAYYTQVFPPPELGLLLVRKRMKNSLS